MVKYYVVQKELLLSRVSKKTLDLITRKQTLKSILKNAYIQNKNTDYQYNEDLFWSLEAKKYDPDFKISRL